MPILSEAGTDRSDILKNARKYVLEFDMVGAQAIAQVPARNRNVKACLVTEAIFHKGNPVYNINDFEHYGQTEHRISPTIERIMNILRMPDSREVFGLTYRDLIEMDDATLTYIYDAVYELYEKRLQAQQEQEKALNGK